MFDGRVPLNGLAEFYIRLDPADIAYVKFILESYEAVGFLRTVDPNEAILVVLVVPDFLDDGIRLLESIAREIRMETIPRPAELGDDWLVQTLAVDP